MNNMMPFKVWMGKVDKVLISITDAFDSGGLPDIGYWDLWNDGASPEEAAAEALENAGYPTEMYEEMLYV